MRTRTAAKAVTGIVVLTMVAAVAVGKPQKRHGRGHGPDHNLGAGLRGVERLELSSEQQTQLESLRAQHEADTSGTREQLRAMHQELEQLWQNEALSEDAIIAKVQGISSLRQQMDVERAKLKLDVVTMLTAEQRAELQTRMSERSERREERAERRSERRADRRDRGEQGSRGGLRPGPGGPGAEVDVEIQ